MKYEERNGLRILTAEFGYLIRNTQTDVYAEKVYLGIYASLDDFEEVKDDVTDIKLVAKLKQIEAKEESLNKIGKIVANQVVDDVVALSIKEFYDSSLASICFSFATNLISVTSSLTSSKSSNDA